MKINLVVVTRERDVKWMDLAGAPKNHLDGWVSVDGVNCNSLRCISGAYPA